MMLYYLFFLYLIILSFLVFWVSVYLYFFKISFILEWMILNFNSLKYEFMLLFDWMSMVFISVIMLISSSVILYSVSYMKNDKYPLRFLYLLLLFIISMFLMILSPNLFSILLGWDGLGLISYCLVIYYQNIFSYNSGMVTILMNRIGDISLLISIGLLMSIGSWNYFLYKNMIIFLMLFILISSMTKSAQFPFSSWLLKAMSAPTPISSLVHSSTLVTAGIYLLIRYEKILNFKFKEILLIISSMTMLISGICAMFENDLKKIIALSTLSQLSFMFVIFSIGLSYLSFFHILTHALFKSLLFLSAGSIIHNSFNNQDIRLINSKMIFYLPFSITMMLSSLLALSGFMFLSGFYSKDLILEFLYYQKMNMFIFLIIVFSTLLTIMYSLRMFMFMNFKNLNFCLFMFNEDNNMIYSMLILFIFCLISGSMMNWMFFDMINLLYLEFKFKMFLIMMFILSSGLFYIYMNIYIKIMNFNYKIMFFSLMNLDYMYKIFNKYMFMMKNFLLFDKGWIEYYGLKMFYFNFNYFKLFYIINYWIMIKLMIIIYLIYIYMF